MKLLKKMGIFSFLNYHDIYFIFNNYFIYNNYSSIILMINYISKSEEIYPKYNKNRSYETILIYQTDIK